MILTIFLYFIIVLGLSFIVDLIINKNKANIYEQFIMRIGIGTLIYSVLGIIMDLLYIPLNIWIILIFSLIPPTIYIYKNKKELTNKNIIKKLKDIKIKEAIFTILALILTIITMTMYLTGSYSYPYLEDGDPWGFTKVAKYTAEEETFKVDYRYAHRAEPYPQGYSIIMGTLHQSNDSIYHTFKTIHNIILGFSIIFFFFFIKELFRNKKNNLEIALFSSIVLFSIPSWISHFLFSLTFNMTLIPIFFYFLLKIEENKKYKYIAALALVALLFNHFYTAFITIILYIIYYLLKLIHTKQFNKEIIEVGFFAFILSFLYYIPTTIRHPEYVLEFYHGSLGGAESFVPQIANLFSNIIIAPILILLIILAIWMLYNENKWFKHIKKILDKKYATQIIFTLGWISFLAIYLIPKEKLIFVKGSGSREYIFNDFWTASSLNLINNPIGWGPVVTILVIIGFALILFKFKDLFKKENFDYFLTLNFALFTFLLVLGMSFSIALSPFRMWTFMAIFISILAGITISKITSYKELSQIITYPIAIIIIVFILTTSFIPKYELNTMPWPEHEIMVPQSYPLYSYIRENIPKDSNMISLCKNSNYLVSFDMLPPIKDPDFNYEFKKVETYNTQFFNKYYSLTQDEIYNFLIEKDVEYVVVGASCIASSRNQSQAPILNNKINLLMNDSRFQIVQATQTELLFKVN